MKAKEIHIIQNYLFLNKIIIPLRKAIFYELSAIFIAIILFIFIIIKNYTNFRFISKKYYS